jgi:dipeptidyl aminopeptidase/acylaminoacyl peptidase
VLVPSLPTPRADPGPMADLGPRLVAIVDAAAADPVLRGAFDPARVALWGYSFGGYTVDAAIGQTDRFRAAIAIAGPSEFISQWETMPALHRSVPEEGLMINWSAGSVETGQEEMGAPPWVDAQRYLANSPVMAADRIHTPLLLIHGDQDAVPLTQSEAMFSALYRQDKDAILVTYWGEGHAFTSPGNVRDLFARAFSFLDAHFATAGAAENPVNREDGPASGAPTPQPSPPKGYSLVGTPR